MSMNPRRLVSCSSAASRSASHAPPERMPTIAACSAFSNAAFTCLARDAYKASASSLRLGIFIEILLQDYGGRLCIDQLVAPLRNHRRRVSFIHQRRVHAEAAMQLICKAPATHGHFMLGAIRLARQADNAQLRPPLVA